MKVTEAIAKRVRQLLTQKNITQYRLAKNMAVPPSMISNILNSRFNSVDMKTVLLICRGINITPGEFFSNAIFENEDIEID